MAEHLKRFDDIKAQVDDLRKMAKKVEDAMKYEGSKEVQSRVSKQNQERYRVRRHVEHLMGGGYGQVLARALVLKFFIEGDIEEEPPREVEFDCDRLSLLPLGANKAVQELQQSIVEPEEKVDKALAKKLEKKPTWSGVWSRLRLSSSTLPFAAGDVKTDFAEELVHRKIKTHTI